MKPYTVIATLEGIPVPPYIEAVDAAGAVAVALAAVMSGDRIENIKTVRTWWESDGKVLDGAAVQAVIPGWHTIEEGEVVGYLEQEAESHGLEKPKTVQDLVTEFEVSLGVNESKDLPTAFYDWLEDGNPNNHEAVRRFGRALARIFRGA